MCALVQVKTGLWFSAKRCMAQSLKDFDIMGVAKQMEVKAPHLLSTVLLHTPYIHYYKYIYA